MKVKKKINFTAWGIDFVNIPVYYDSEQYTSIGVAGTAEMIRQQLKKEFPGYKFWVRSSSFSMGDSINLYAWNVPDEVYAIISKYPNRYQEGNFNGMSDIYENRKMETIVTDTGKKIDYGTKYMFTYNAPPYGTPEYDKPAPDYSKMSSSSSSASSKQSSPSKKYVPRGKFTKKDGDTKKEHPVTSDPDFILIGETSTGWELYYKNVDVRHCIVAMVFNYSIGKPVFNSEEWKKLKEVLLLRNSMIWSLRDKCFYITQLNSDTGVSGIVVEKRFAERMLEGERFANFTNIAILFQAHGYKNRQGDPLEKLETIYYERKIFGSPDVLLVKDYDKLMAERNAKYGFKEKDVKTKGEVQKETKEHLPLPKDVDSMATALNSIYSPTTQPLTEKEFDRKYKAQHKDLRGKSSGEHEKTKEMIMKDGFWEGFNVNALPISKGGQPMNVIDRDYGNKQGDIVYILPKEGFTEGSNGYKTKKGHVPTNREIVTIEYDTQSTYEAYSNQFFKNLAKDYFKAKADGSDPVLIKQIEDLFISDDNSSKQESSSEKAVLSQLIESYRTMERLEDDPETKANIQNEINGLETLLKYSD